MSSEQDEIPINSYKTCINLPLRVDSLEPSHGPMDSGVIFVNSLPVLQVQMCIIFFGTFLFKCIFRRFGIPRFTSMSIVSPIMFLYCHCSYCFCFSVYLLIYML